MYLLVDNYDSFTYNLYALLKHEGADVTVIRNDDPIPAENGYAGIVLSPGPSRPEQAGITPEVIRRYKGKVPMFGVCLGMQAIGQAMGFDIRRANSIQHGKTDQIRFNESAVLFKGMNGPVTAVRYHSLAVDAPAGKSPVMAVAASDGEIMAIEDTEQMLYGVQFHPESFMSEQGSLIIRNFLSQCEREQQGDMRTERPDLKGIAGNRPMTFRESKHVFNAMIRGELSDVETTAILTGLRVRGETSDEIAGAAEALNRNKVPFDRMQQEAVDTCGTGGDGKSCMNVSTAASLTVAALDVPVVKHGNRAMSGTVGSADILESLDIPVTPEKNQAEQMFRDFGFVFLFAPAHHPAMRHVVPVRKALRFPTIFNLVGPLANPADPPYQVIGLPRMELLETMAEAARHLDRKRIILYSSEDGYDEVSTAAPTHCVSITPEGTGSFIIRPDDFFPPRPMPVVRSSEEAELTFLRAINGSDPDLVNLVALNAGLALMCCGKCPDLKSGFDAARQALEQGTVSAKLKQLAVIP